MLGAHLLYQLSRKQDRVKASCRTSSNLALAEKIFSYYDNGPELWKGVEWVETDLEDPVAVSDLLEGVDCVYHSAALVSFDPLDGPAMLEINPLITGNLVNAALEKGVEKMIHVSSVAALGRSSQRQSISENSHWNADGENSVYAKSKYKSELEVWRGAAEGLKVAVVNPGVILGPGDWTTGSAKLFHSIAENFRFYTEGINGFVDVRDVAEVMIRLMESEIKDERFVLVAENKNYKELFQKIADALDSKRPSVKARPWMGELVWRAERFKSFLTGKKPLVTPETARTAHQVNRYDNSKVKDALDYRFRPLEETVKDFAQLYLNDHKD